MRIEEFPVKRGGDPRERLPTTAYIIHALNRKAHLPALRGLIRKEVARSGRWNPDYVYFYSWKDGDKEIRFGLRGDGQYVKHMVEKAERGFQSIVKKVIERYLRDNGIDALWAS